MANIFSLYGTIFIDNEKATKKLKETEKSAESTGSKVGNAFKSIAKGAAAVGTAVVTGATAVGAAAYKMASDTAFPADKVDKMSQKLGMSRKAYQEWDYVLSQAGVEITSMSTGLKTLTNKIDDAKNGSSSATAMFDKLGISMSDLQSMSREDMFDAVITSMQGMEDSTERAALANDLFGKSGQELTALFNESAESTENLKNKAHELGMIMSDETIDSGVKFTDTMDTIKRALSGMMNTLGGTVLPIVQSVLNLIQSKLPDIQALFVRISPIIQSVFDGVLPPLFDLAEVLLPILFDLIESLFPVIESIIISILPIIVNLLQLLLPFLVQIITQILPIIVKLMESLMPLVMQLLNSVLSPVIQLLQALLPPVLQIVQSALPIALKLLQTLLPPVLKIIDIVLPVLIDLINTIIPFLIQIIDAILPVLIVLVDTLLPPILDIIDMILPLLTDLLNGIVPILSNLLSSILPVIIGLIELIAPIMKPILDLLIAVLDPLLDLLDLILPPLINLVVALIDKALSPLRNAFSLVSEVLTGMFKGAIVSVGQYIDNLRGIFTGIIDFVKNVFTGNWRGAWNAVVNIFSNVFGGIKNAFKIPINWIIDGINTFIRGLNKLKIPDWVPGVGGKGINIGQLSRLRIGMDYVPYDEFPALLHKGERVLTASENKEYSEANSRNILSAPIINISFEPKSIYVDHLDGDNEQDVSLFADRLMEIMSEKIYRSGRTFA